MFWAGLSSSLTGLENYPLFRGCFLNLNANILKWMTQCLYAALGEEHICITFKMLHFYAVLDWSSCCEPESSFLYSCVSGHVKNPIWMGNLRLKLSLMLYHLGELMPLSLYAVRRDFVSTHVIFLFMVLCSSKLEAIFDFFFFVMCLFEQLNFVLV